MRLDRIKVDPTLNVREGLDEETVARYMECFEELPPVDVFDGGLLVDGFHRVEAAKRLGLEEIEAKQHKGDRRAALVFAAIANTDHGKPLTQKERRAAAERLLDNTDWSHVEIARRLGTAPRTVDYIVDERVVRSQICDPGKLSPSHFVEISVAPENHWQPLADRAAESDWTAREVRAAAQVLKADDVTAEQKAGILDGSVPPFDARPEEGPPKVYAETRKREEKKHKKEMRSDAESKLYDLLAAATALRATDYIVALHEMPASTKANVLGELEELVALLTDVLNEATAKKLVAVK